MQIRGVLVKIEKNGMEHQQDEWIGKKYLIKLSDHPYQPGLLVGKFIEEKEKYSAINTSTVSEFNLNPIESTLKVKTNNSTYFFTVYKISE